MLPPYGLCLPCTGAGVRPDGVLYADVLGLHINFHLDMAETPTQAALGLIVDALTNGSALSLVVSNLDEVARMLKGPAEARTAIRGEIYVGTEDKLSDLLRHAGQTVAPPDDSAGPG